MPFVSPKTVVNKLNIQPGMTVADFGAGNGDYAIATAQMVGQQGRVYAVDIREKMVNRVKGKAKEKDIENLDVIWGDLEELEGSRLDADVADRIIVANILFQLKNKEVFMQELSRVLKKNGEVYAIDWTGSFEGVGPPERLVVTKDDAVALFENHGFSVERNIDAGSHHWGFAAKQSA